MNERSIYRLEKVMSNGLVDIERTSSHSYYRVSVYSVNTLWNGLPQIMFVRRTIEECKSCLSKVLMDMHANPEFNEFS